MWDLTPITVRRNIAEECYVYTYVGGTANAVKTNLTHSMAESNWAFIRRPGPSLPEWSVERAIAVARVVRNRNPMMLQLGDQCKIYKEELEILISIPSLRVVEFLDLSIDDETVDIIVDAMKLPFLESLTFNEMSLDAGFLVRLVTTKPRNLVFLDLTAVNMDQDTFDAFANNIGEGTFGSNIKTLYLRNGSVYHLQNVHKIFDACPILSILDITGHIFGCTQIEKYLLPSILVHRFVREVTVFDDDSWRDEIKACLGLAYRRDLNAMWAFLSMRRRRGDGCASVSKLFVDADKLLGRFLIGSVWE